MLDRGHQVDRAPVADIRCVVVPKRIVRRAHDAQSGGVLHIVGNGRKLPLGFDREGERFDGLRTDQEDAGPLDLPDRRC